MFSSNPPERRFSAGAKAVDGILKLPLTQL